MYMPFFICQSVPIYVVQCISNLFQRMGVCHHPVCQSVDVYVLLSNLLLLFPFPMLSG